MKFTIKLHRLIGGAAVLLQSALTAYGVKPSYSNVLTGIVAIIGGYLAVTSVIKGKKKGSSIG